METDEIQCQVENPFDRKNAVANTVVAFIPFFISIYAVAKYKPRKLPLLLGAQAVFLTVGRRMVCARCQYYGQECSTMLGIMAAKMMPKDESRPLQRNDIIADFVLLFLPGVIAFPQTHKNHKLALLYTASVVAALGALLFNGCGKCGNDFCPLKDVHKAIVRT